MSFAAKVKKELTQLEPADTFASAELAALVRMNGSLSFGRQQVGLDITTENAAIARRIYTLLKQVFPDTFIELLVRKKMRLKKNNVYLVRVSRGAQALMEQLGILGEGFTIIRTIDPHVIDTEQRKRAYMRGAFLAGGSVNHPETSSYHLEIFSSSEEHNISLCELMNEYGLRAKTLERKKGYIVYIKESEKITEFLSIIGAHQALLYFEDVRILKDMRNSVNRLVNCETANLNKTVGAALRQVENIRLIQRTIGLEQLPPKLREIALLRLTHQDVTLKELGDMLEGGKVSKSGINHRLKKIDEVAEKIRNGEVLKN
ncbi:DNA-binding protein WhiA [Alkalicoccobacillus porphyridii]|uniref:Probable cell division protein WhiA n=1 Tax=Alkalicoccobacillus porphyridii TaxID=2597270 RepID=A0A554A3L1_9BACI|nr:DNA-binding protein WhiA [Alkalicoccobacillus porphyridii]TSB48279.1 DNA-binding protein WhiA [Alkalicoccobacillus porphyridii]